MVVSNTSFPKPWYTRNTKFFCQVHKVVIIFHCAISFLQLQGKRVTLYFASQQQISFSPLTCVLKFSDGPFKELFEGYPIWKFYIFTLLCSLKWKQKPCSKETKFISSFHAFLDLLSYYSVHVGVAQKRKDNSLPYGQFVGKHNKFLKMALGSDFD